MLASTLELESSLWREGMIEGLTASYSLASGNGLHGRRLYFAMLRRFMRLAPRAYRRYLRTYTRMGRNGDGRGPLLSFWQWRSAAADLAELVQLSVMLGCSPGEQADELRITLLLAADEPGDGPYSSLRDHGCPLDAAPHLNDGLIDGYKLCSKLARDEALHDISFIDSVIEYLDALWPEDYRRYRYRYIRHIRASRAELAGQQSPDWGPRLDYAAWSSAVQDLHDEVGRCRSAGKAVSPKSLDLSRRLLCEPGEPLPALAWTIVPKLQEALVW